MDLGLMKKLTPVLGSYFPETLHRMYLIHANIFVRSGFSVAKGFIHPRTLTKIKVMGSDAEEIRTVLAGEGITPECLPVWFGGTLVGEGVAVEPPYNDNE